MNRSTAKKRIETLTIVRDSYARSRSSAHISDVDCPNKTRVYSYARGTMCSPTSFRHKPDDGREVECHR